MSNQVCGVSLTCDVLGKSPNRRGCSLSLPLETLACHPVLQLPSLLPVSSAALLAPQCMKLILLFLGWFSMFLHPWGRKLEQSKSGHFCLHLTLENYVLKMQMSQREVALPFDQLHNHRLRKSSSIYYVEPIFWIIVERIKRMR